MDAETKQHRLWACGKFLKKEAGKKHTIKETTGEEKTLKAERYEVSASLLPLPTCPHIPHHACPLDPPELHLSGYSFHCLKPQGLRQTQIVNWLTTQLTFCLSFPCSSYSCNWSKNCLRAKPIPYNSPSYCTVPGSDKASSIQHVPRDWNLVLPIHQGQKMPLPHYSGLLQMFHDVFLRSWLTCMHSYTGRLLKELSTLQFLHPILHRLLIPQLHWKHSPKSQRDQCCQSLCHGQHTLLGTSRGFSCSDRRPHLAKIFVSFNIF